MLLSMVLDQVVILILKHHNLIISIGKVRVAAVILHLEGLVFGIQSVIVAFLLFQPMLGVVQLLVLNERGHAHRV